MKPTADLLLAADSGGTGTRMRLLTRDGVTVARAEAPGVAAVLAGTLPVADSLRQAKDALGAEAGRAKDVYFSLGGPNTGEVEDALARLWPDARRVVDREANGGAVLFGGGFFGCRAAVLAGTGTTAMGEIDGQRRYAGGWGPALDDAGSGGWLGLRALQRFLFSIDRRSGGCPEERAVEDSSDAGGLADIFGPLLSGLDIGYFGDRMAFKQCVAGLSRAELAAYAPAVAALAQKGDAVARGLIEDMAAALADLAAAVTPPRPASKEDDGVLGLGGVFRLGEGLRDACRRALARTRPAHRWAWPKGFGLEQCAVLMVLRQAGVAVDQALFERVRGSGT